LDDAMVFAELKSQGRIAQTGEEDSEVSKTKEGFAIERVNLISDDGGFKEWQEKYWWARVYSGKEYGEYVRMALDKTKAPPAAPAAAKPADSAVYADLEKARRANNSTAGRTAPSASCDSVSLLRPALPITVPGEKPPPQVSYRSWPQRRPADDFLWVVLVVVLIFYAWRFFKDQFDSRGDGASGVLHQESLAATAAKATRRHLVSVLASSPALASAKVGDTITSEMVAELAKLFSRP